MSIALLDLLDRSAVATRTVLAGITDRQRAADTPCQGFTVEQLAAHLIGGLAWFAGLPGGGPTDPRTLPDPDLAGRSLPDAFRAAADAVRHAWTPARLEDTFALPSGPTRGAGLAGYMIVEVLGHGWDLAVATGQPFPVADELANEALAVARELGEETLRAPGMLGPRVEVAADTPSTGRLVAFLGRDPSRTPASPSG